VQVEAKLAIAVEALEWYAKLKPSEFDTCAENALAKISSLRSEDKGEK
jgi:hypothetical protein